MQKIFAAVLASFISIPGTLVVPATAIMASLSETASYTLVEPTDTEVSMQEAATVNFDDKEGALIKGHPIAVEMPAQTLIATR